MTETTPEETQPPTQVVRRVKQRITGSWRTYHVGDVTHCAFPGSVPFSLGTVVAVEEIGEHLWVTFEEGVPSGYKWNQRRQEFKVPRHDPKEVIMGAHCPCHFTGDKHISMGEIVSVTETEDERWITLKEIIP